MESPCKDCNAQSEGTWPEYSQETLGSFEVLCLGCMIGLSYWLGFGEGQGSYINFLPTPVVPEPPAVIGWPPIPPGGWPLV